MPRLRDKVCLRQGYKTQCLNVVLSYQNNSIYDKAKSTEAVITKSVKISPISNENCEYSLKQSRCEKKPQRLNARTSTFFMICHIFLFLHLFQMLTPANGSYYSGYISSILQTQTATACEGNNLYIICPPMTTISIESAMYGRKLPNRLMCPMYASILHSPAPLVGKENLDCEAETSLAKTASECESKRHCQLLVNQRVFGGDPCPDTTKYLKVTYKCRLLPKEFRTGGTCASTNLKLRCPRSIIAIYNVTVTHQNICANKSLTNCSITSNKALDDVTKRCHQKQKCNIPTSSDSCGNYVHVEYACIPKRYLTRRLPSSNLSLITTTKPTTTSTTTTTLPTTTSTATTISSTSSLVASSSIQSTATKNVFIPKVVSITTTLNLSPTTTITSSKPDLVTSSASSLTTTTRTATDQTSVLTRTTTKSIATPRTKNKDTKVQASNEFPMPTDDPALESPPFTGKDDSISGQINASTPYLNATTMLANNTVTPSIYVENESYDDGLYFIRGVTAVVMFIRANTDRLLAVIFGSICIGLLLTVVMLLLRSENVKYFRTSKKKKKNAEQPETAETQSLLANSHPSHAGSSSTAPGNLLLYSTPPDSDGNLISGNNHVDYLARIADNRRLKSKKSRTQVLLKKWCTCCCTNAPWQRDAGDDDCYQIPRRSTTSLSDDVISAVASGNNHFDGVPAPVFSSSPQEDNQEERSVSRYNPFPTDENGGYQDNTSEYEYQDEIDATPNTSSGSDPPIARPTTLQSSTNHDRVPLTLQHRPRQQPEFNNISSALTLNLNNSGYQNRPVVSSQHGGHVREPLPFPKSVNYGYHSQPQHIIPHYATQRVPYNNGYHPNHNQVNRQVYQPVAQRIRPNQYTPSFSDHYVAFQPQRNHQPNTRTLNDHNNTNEPRMERRDSFYDNSLPRGSPLYEYYQRQTRQELPGTRNLNQYY